MKTNKGQEAGAYSQSERPDDVVSAKLPIGPTPGGNYIQYFTADDGDAWYSLTRDEELVTGVMHANPYDALYEDFELLERACARELGESA